ncbi:MAG: hypothetical protein HQM13_00890 [SAR324 cluster bacterium]|nr:hypothetical protein [SAR324 cluster bacterium]
MTENKNNPAKSNPFQGTFVPTSDCPVSADPALTAEGWNLRFYGDLRMAQESMDTYRDLNFEVRLEPVNTKKMTADCSGCVDFFTNFRMVYTRKKR